MTPSAAAALKFVKKHGVVLESARGPAPTFVDFVAGKPVKQQWWSHPLGRQMFRLTRIIRDSPDVVTCRMIDGKITYVHKRVWPALVKLSGRFDKKNLAAVREEHTSTGKHRLVKTPFPRWIPAEVIQLGGKLSEAEAKSLLHLV
jgi:hypothetical protein